MPRANFSGAHSASRPVKDNFLDTLLVFVKWSQGRTDLGSTLQCLAEYIGADAIALTRWDKNSARLAGFADDRSDPLSPRLTQSYAPAVLGGYIDSIKPGTAITLSDTHENRSVSDPALERWMFNRCVIEVACICVAAEGGTRDIVEIHFARSVPKLWDDEQEMMSRMMHDVYQGRKRGLVMQQLLRTNATVRRTAKATMDKPLLAVENPARLTRSEWRVCALIANGLSREGIAEEMAVKPGTLRTHLRNIYAKTGYERFHELALRLVSTKERESLGIVDQEVAA